MGMGLKAPNPYCDDCSIDARIGVMIGRVHPILVPTALWVQPDDWATGRPAWGIYLLLYCDSCCQMILMVVSGPQYTGVWVSATRLHIQILQG